MPNIIKIANSIFPSLLANVWSFMTGNLVYMTANNAPSPYVATTNYTPTSGSPYNAFDNSSLSAVTFNYGDGGVFWAKMMWTNPIRIVQMMARVHRSGQENTLFRIYGIKADTNEVLIYSGTHTSDTDITVNSTDSISEFVGVKIEIERRVDLIVSIKNFRILQWYSK